MCGRYTVTRARQALQEYFGIEVAGGIELPVYNAAPGRRLPVVLGSDPRRALPASWGIRIPAGGGHKGRLLINARSETVHTRPAFRDSFLRRRCLVIADGFYEWKTMREGKQPYRITLRNGELFAFAGVWEDVDQAPCFVILTTGANAVTGPIHDRMPVILDPLERARWLAADASEALKLLDPYPGDEMIAYRVSREVNSSRNEHPALVESVE